MNMESNWIFGVVANIKKERTDKNGVLRYGAKPYVGGTKVYINGKDWDFDREEIGAIGRNRFGRIALEFIPIDCLENLRITRIYNPAVLEIIYREESQEGWEWWSGDYQDKKHAKEFVKNFNKLILEKIK